MYWKRVLLETLRFHQVNVPNFAPPVKPPQLQKARHQPVAGENEKVVLNTSATNDCKLQRLNCQWKVASFFIQQGSSVQIRARPTWLSCIPAMPSDENRQHKPSENVPFKKENDKMTLVKWQNDLSNMTKCVIYSSVMVFSAGFFTYFPIATSDGTEAPWEAEICFLAMALIVISRNCSRSMEPFSFKCLSATVEAISSTKASFVATILFSASSRIL